MLWYRTETIDNGIPMPVPSALMLMPSYDKNNNNCSATRVDRSVGGGMYLLWKSVSAFPQLLFLVNKVYAIGLWTCLICELM
jgi:hypothetical protein